MDPISALIGAGGSLIGGLIQGESDKATRDMNMDMFRQQMQWSRESFWRSRADQNAFNKYGAGWKLQNIKKVAGQLGIHPLAAMGVSGSYSPVNAQGVSAPTLQSGTSGPLIGDAITEGLEALVGKKQKREDEIYGLDKRRKEAEIELIEAQSRTLGTRATRMARDGGGDITEKTFQDNNGDSGNPPDGADVLRKDNPLDFEPDSNFFRDFVNGDLAPKLWQNLKKNAWKGSIEALDQWSEHLLRTGKMHPSLYNRVQSEISKLRSKKQ